LCGLNFSSTLSFIWLIFFLYVHLSACTGLILMRTVLHKPYTRTWSLQYINKGVYIFMKNYPPLPDLIFFFPTRLVCFRALIAELSSFSFSFPRSLKIILNVFTFYNNNSCVSKTSIFRKLIVIFIYFIFINFYIYTRNILKKCEIFKKKGLWIVVGLRFVQ